MEKKRFGNDLYFKTIMNIVGLNTSTKKNPIQVIDVFLFPKGFFNLKLCKNEINKEYIVNLKLKDREIFTKFNQLYFC